MAVMAIGVAAYAGATYAGLAAYAGIIATVAMTAYQYWDASRQVTKSEGPRLTDKTVMTSEYGSVIPRLYGTRRISGSVIWAAPITEREQTDTYGGGKGGGGSQEVTTYSYYATLAIALCDTTTTGEVYDVSRCWANGKLVFDLTPESDGEARRASSTYDYTFYNGSMTQNPDPTMESYLGVGNVPAYRGTAYLVIKDFPLADFGNSIPNLTFEVSSKSLGDLPTQYSKFATEPHDYSIWDRRVSAQNGLIYRYSAAEQRYPTYDSNYTIMVREEYDFNGNLLHRQTSGRFLDPNVYPRAGTTRFEGMTSRGTVMMVNTTDYFNTSGGIPDFGAYNSSVYFLDPFNNTLTSVVNLSAPALYEPLSDGAFSCDEDDDFYYVSTSGSEKTKGLSGNIVDVGLNTRLYKIPKNSLSKTTGYVPQGTKTISPYVTIGQAGETYLSISKGVLWVYISGAASKYYRTSDMSEITPPTIPDGFSLVGFGDDGIFVANSVVGRTTKVHKLDLFSTSTRILKTYDFTFSNDVTPDSLVSGVAFDGTYISKSLFFFSEQVNPAPVKISDIVVSEGKNAGIPATAFNASNVTDVETKGFLATSSARDSLEILKTAYNLDVVPSGDKVVVRKKTTTATQTIGEDNLIGGT